MNGGTDVLFLDPPWGGKDYKNKSKIVFDFGGIHLADLCDFFLTFSNPEFPLDTDLHWNSLITRNMKPNEKLLNSRSLFNKLVSPIKIVALKLPFNYDTDDLVGKFKAIEENNINRKKTYLIERLDIHNRNMILLLFSKTELPKPSRHSSFSPSLTSRKRKYASIACPNENSDTKKDKK